MTAQAQFPTALDIPFEKAGPNPYVPNPNGVGLQQLLNALITPAITALEAKVGINGSTDPTSLDYRVSQVVGNTLAAPTVSGLRGMSVAAVSAYTPLLLLGYYNVGDGGEGTLFWNATDVRADDGGTVFKPNSVSGAGRWNRSLVNAIFISLPWFGAVSGATDYTANIDAAGLYCYTNGKTLYAPAGSYVYNGSGVGGSAWSRPSLFGDGRGKTIFTLGASTYLISVSTLMSSLVFRDVTTVNGLGAIQHTYTGVNVQEYMYVESCQFNSYTQCAVYSTAQDMPYWRLKNCQFLAANDTSTMGFSLAGYCDSLLIIGCSFLKNTVHIKLKRGGNNAYIEACDLLRWDAYTTTPRISIWVVPETVAVNAGPGLTIRSCKFGNENLSTSDWVNVYADETVTGDVSTSFPNYTTQSVGYIEGHSYSHNLSNNIGIGSPPFIFTTTLNVRGCQVGDMNIAGGAPSYIVQYLSSLLPIPADRATTSNVFGPFYGSAIGTEPSAGITISNAVGIGLVIDPNAIINDAGRSIVNSGGGRSAGFTIALSSLVTSLTGAGGATVTPITDAVGGTDAATLNLTTGQCYAYLTAAAIVVGNPMWVEFDIQSPGSSPLNTVECLIALDTYQSGGAISYRRQLVPGTTWAPKRFLWYPRITGSNIIISFRAPTYSTGAQVNIGQIRIYPASEPLNVDMAIPGGGKVKTRAYTLTNVNMNAGATDVGTFNNLPAKYTVIQIRAYDASRSLTTATLDLRTGTGGTGTALVSAASLAALTAATKFSDLTLATIATTDYQTSSTLTVRCNQAQGAAATLSLRLEVLDLTP